MEEKKPIAIIITAYNSMPLIELTIDSIRDSTEYPFKIIIVESGSNDGTAKWCD